MSADQRASLRAQYQARRLAVSASQRNAWSQGIAARVLTQVERLRAASVALFWPMIERGEVDLRGLDQTLRDQGVARFYPFMDSSGGHGWRRIDSPKELTRGPRGFHQPEEGEAANRGQLDLVLVPALAGTREGDRLGYGGGFYDRVLPTVRPPAQAFVVLFENQVVESLPVAAHDVRCDGLITEAGIYTGTRG